MDLKKVLDALRSNQNEDAKLTILFVQKSGINYKAYKPEVKNSVQKDIIKLFADYVETLIDNDLNEVKFNPSGQLNGEYSVCDYEYVGNFQQVINLFSETLLEEELRPDQISFLIYRLRINEDTDENKYIYIFRRNHKLKSIRKGFWIRKVSELYSKLDSELIGIDGNIDAIAFEGELAFFSHFTAERFFNLRDKFIENAKEVLIEVQKGEKIDNFTEFEEDCLNDARVTRRLTKMKYTPEIVDLFHKHFENANEVVELFDLNISFNEDKSRIVYTDTSELTDITMLMRDAYYRTVLAKRKGIDDFN